MGKFNQDLAMTTTQRRIERDAKGALVMTVDTLSPDGEILRSQIFSYSIGQKGWVEGGAFAFSASTATDDAIKAIGGACQGDVDTATAAGFFDFKAAP